MASHAALQYLPDVVGHEQTGCAHFSSFTGVIIIPSNRGTGADDPGGNIRRTGESVLCRTKDTTILVAKPATRRRRGFWDYSRRLSATACRDPWLTS
jgi:hypothetical protein